MYAVRRGERLCGRVGTPSSANHHLDQLGDRAMTFDGMPGDQVFMDDVACGYQDNGAFRCYEAIDELPIASRRVSRVRAAVLRNGTFNMAKAFSIGLGSGL
jgi:hypothetical protein